MDDIFKVEGSKELETKRHVYVMYSYIFSRIYLGHTQNPVIRVFTDRKKILKAMHGHYHSCLLVVCYRDKTDLMKMPKKITTTD